MFNFFAQGMDSVQWQPMPIHRAYHVFHAVLEISRLHQIFTEHVLQQVSETIGYACRMIAHSVFILSCFR